MTLPHTPAQALRAMIELTGHPFGATAQAIGLLGHDGVQKAIAEIGAVLIRADAFNPRWVAVAYWDHGGQQLQAISRFWPDGGAEYRTEVSLESECHGGYAAALALTVLETWTPDQLPAAGWKADPSRPRPPTPDSKEAWMILHGPYRIVYVATPVVREGEAKLQE